jgi:hypothetical protein
MRRIRQVAEHWALLLLQPLDGERQAPDGTTENKRALVLIQVDAN